jgi:putative flippase GtrA
MTTMCRSLLTRACMVRSHAARPLRFAGTGGTAAAVQLLCLTFLTHHGWNTILANGVAFLLSAQLNFVLSVTFTWRDRLGSSSLRRRWVLYHGSIAFMALANMLVFVTTRAFLPTLVASLAGIAVGAAGNYFLGDRLVFRGISPRASTPAHHRSAA